MSQTQAHPVVATIVGNGFTIDLTTQLGLTGIDPTKPLDWPIPLVRQPQLSLADALPQFYPAMLKLREQRQDLSHFDILRELAGPRENAGSAVEIETRHFLTLAYRFFTEALNLAPVEHWRWLHWFRAHSALLLTTVSFNYDCLLERILSLTGRQYHRQHNLAPGIIRVFKPHGSCDFDLEGITRAELSYPIRLYGHMNNCPLRIVTSDEWLRPPVEPLVVLPYEENPYSSFQWVSPGYGIFRQLGTALTHCLFVGLSYHPADRAEIDHFLDSTAPDCRIIIANRTPPTDLVAKVRASGRRLYLWQDGPEPLPWGD